MILKQIAKGSAATQTKREQEKKKWDHWELCCVSTQDQVGLQD